MMLSVQTHQRNFQKIHTMAPETFPRNQTPPTTPNNHVAIIFGVTGLVGKELAKRLVSKPNWKVYGIARRPEPVCTSNNNFHFISCDLLDPKETQHKVSLLEDVTHIFWVTWASHYPLDSPECCDQNRAMMVNVLNAILPRAPSLKHVSLQTGMKHYVSLSRPSVGQAVRYFDEECPRVVEPGCNNFYYDLEDLLMERLEGLKVAFSVHRPGLLTGSSRKTLYNFMGSLCVYGTICRYMNLPFVFGGTKERWEEVSIDGSDAQLVAEQHIWAATATDDRNSNFEAFNCINGVPFTWKAIWPSIGKKFGVQVTSDMFQQDFTYSSFMADKKKVWRDIVKKEGLVHTDMEDLANWGFLDILFRCPVTMLGSRQKVDRFGFTMRCETLDSIFYWIDQMRMEKLIP